MRLAFWVGGFYSGMGAGILATCPWRASVEHPLALTTLILSPVVGILAESLYHRLRNARKAAARSKLPKLPPASSTKR